MKKNTSITLRNDTPKKKLPIPPKFAASYLMISIFQYVFRHIDSNIYQGDLLFGKLFPCDTWLLLVSWRICWYRPSRDFLLAWLWISSISEHWKVYNNCVTNESLPNIIRFHRVLVFDTKTFGQTFAIDAGITLREKRWICLWFFVGQNSWAIKFNELFVVGVWWCIDKHLRFKWLRHFKPVAVHGGYPWSAIRQSGLCAWYRLLNGWNWTWCIYLGRKSWPNNCSTSSCSSDGIRQCNLVSNMANLSNEALCRLFRQLSISHHNSIVGLRVRNFVVFSMFCIDLPQQQPWSNFQLVWIDH